MVVALAATWRLVDVSISSGAMGMLLPMLAIPPLSVALVAWAVASRRPRAPGPGGRRWLPPSLIACGVWTLAKTGGFTSNFDNDLMWRWTATPEERLLADTTAALPPAAPAAAAPRALAHALPAPEADEGAAEVLRSRDAGRTRGGRRHRR